MDAVQRAHHDNRAIRRIGRRGNLDNLAVEYHLAIYGRYVYTPAVEAPQQGIWTQRDQGCIGTIRLAVRDDGKNPSGRKAHAVNPNGEPVALGVQDDRVRIWKERDSGRGEDNGDERDQSSS